MNEKQLQLEVYRVFDSKLKKLAESRGINSKNLNKYFSPHKENTSPLYYLCVSLQNSGIMRNSIKFSEKGDYHNYIKEATFNFDANKTVSHYKKWQDLYNKVKKLGVKDNGKGKNTNWTKYCKGIYEGSKYLVKDNGIQEINNLTKVNVLTDKELKTITSISKKIHGIGFALTCDWLKEYGCTWLAKPDTHIIDIVACMNSAITKEKDIMKYMSNWANIIKQSGVDKKMTAYKLDKMIWLLCTENFYLDSIGGKRDMLKEINKCKLRLDKKRI